MRVLYILYLDEKLDASNALMCVQGFFDQVALKTTKEYKTRITRVFDDNFKRRLRGYKSPFYWAAFSESSSTLVK